MTRQPASTGSDSAAAAAAAAAAAGGRAPSGPARSRKAGPAPSTRPANNHHREQLHGQVRGLQGLVEQCRMAVARAQAFAEEQDPAPSAKHASKGPRVRKVDSAVLKRKLETALSKHEDSLAAVVEAHAHQLKEVLKQV